MHRAELGQNGGMLAALLVVISDTIFDGKTFDGWTPIGDGNWSVVDGAIRGVCKAADKQGLLVYKNKVRNFAASFEFKIASGNSGFYFRSQRIEEQPLVAGFQAEVDATSDVGGIWETNGRGWIFKPEAAMQKRTKYVPGRWTKMEVRAIGSHYTVSVAGVIVTDIKDDRGSREGIIALQLHGGMDMTVEFRDMRLTNLPD